MEISVEKIKPSSPTPHHLRIYNISVLDQMAACYYVPLVLYFYDNNSGENDDERIKHLKESLSQTLATFYPFAGVIRDALSADCSDQGLPFYVAKVNSQMKDFLQNPNFEFINKLFPCVYNTEKQALPGDNVMLIQLNCFDCGGIAMSVVFAHAIADITSVSTFLRCWAANARGLGFSSQAASTLLCTPQSSFPQNPSLTNDLIPFYNLLKYSSRGKFVTRRYVFDASALSFLKAQMSSLTASRVNVVTALVWKCFMEAVAEEAPGKDVQPFLLTQAVDLRKRAAPPFPEDSFGNMVWVTKNECSSPQEKELGDMVWEVKRGIANIDGELVRRLELGGDGLREYLEELRNEMPQQANWLCFSSWVNRGLDEVDFGWGKPVWLSGYFYTQHSELESVIMCNAVMLLDSKDGGIEAVAYFDQKYVAGFEKNDQIRNYARVNPSVI